MISNKHKNRQAHNWLIYDSSDRFLLRYSSVFNGVLFDFGSGESPYTDFFLEHARQYIAIDWGLSDDQIKPDVIADLNEPLPIGSQVADTVVSLSVMEHLHTPLTMLSEAFRLLKPGGHIVIQVPWQWWIHEGPYDFYRYTPYALQYLLDKAGFVDVEVEPQSGIFTTLILKLNYFTTRLVRGPKPMRYLIKCLLVPFWYIGQKLAPWLDRMDNNWMLETSGYFVMARKP